jgi:hypothetical protein
MHPNKMRALYSFFLKNPSKKALLILRFTSQASLSRFTSFLSFHRKAVAKDEVSSGLPCREARGRPLASRQGRPLESLLSQCFY